MSASFKPIFFQNRTITVSGNLFFPHKFDEAKTYPAIVLATPGSSVKEQIGAIYAAKLAANGFMALTFDPSYQGESSGEPRDLEDPATRVEDIRCAVDFLMTVSSVDEERVGLLGICAGGGYAINAALIEHRIKAIGTVVATNMGQAFRRMLSPEDIVKTLKAVGNQRTIEARGGQARRDNWIPDSLQDAHAAGVTDTDTLQAVEFYRESQWKHPHSTNRLYFASFGSILGFDAYHLVPQLLTQPLQVIVGGRRGTTFQYEAGEELYRLAPREKDFFVVEGAGHYEMYHVPEYVDQAIDQLVSFYAGHLG